MHRIDDPQVNQTMMADFAFVQCVGNNTDHLRAGGKRRVCEHSHQPNIAAAVNNAETTGGDGACRCTRRFGVNRAVTRIGATKYANAMHSLPSLLLKHDFKRCWLGQPQTHRTSIIERESTLQKEIYHARKKRMIIKERMRVPSAFRSGLRRGKVCCAIPFSTAGNVASSMPMLY